MIWRLTYCNKDGVEARLDIIRGASTPVEVIEGTATPFVLNYKMDKSDKSGHVMSSSADISIFETPTFNIDNLKTSNETEIKVDYYINNIKKWTGFVIPDFFSKEIGKRSVVSMVASDRIGTLKGVTLTDLNAFVSLRTLAEKCLLKTGLSLPLKTMVDLESDAVNFFNTDALSQRLVDNKGRSISCYDILSSILVASNSIILQRNAEWYIVNKLQHELGQGKLYSNSTTFTNWQDIIHNFSDVTVGARRTIIPVAASTGVYHEHGGGMLHPDNYDFSKGLTGWSAVGGFVAAVDNKEIKGFTTTSSGAVYTPVYGNATEKSYLINENEYIRNVNPKYIESEEISIPYNGQGSIDVEVNVNALAAAVYATPVFILPVIRIAVVATNGSDVLTLDHSGKFVTMPSINPPVHEQTFEKGEVKNVGDVIPFLTEGKRVKGTLEVSNLEQYKLKIRIYGTQRAVYFHSVDLLMRNTAEAPKGTIFKTEQGSNYTKEHEIDTSIFGDYMTGGLNGYFYKYPIDDTSSLYSNGVLTSKWTDITDPGVERSLLHHIATQRSRMFSQAHDLVSVEMDIRLFDPLSIYVACSKRYTLVSATVDFLRGRANLEIEEVVFQNLIKRDFIYSYFGDGESGIKSIGGISSGTGGGGSGGGMTADQVAILSEVQVLAHDHGNKEVLDQVTQDVVDNALREMIISTDTETELTDENYLSSLRVLKEILDNNEYLRTQFLSKVNPDTAQEIIKFVKGIEIGTFTTGPLGAGAAIKMENGVSRMEVDQLDVRMRATFRELIIESLKHIGGQLILSPARMKCTSVVDGGTYYKCYFDTGDGKVSNEFVAGDQARCQVFTGSGVKMYWRLVTSVGTDWINLSKTDAISGSSIPEAGDDIVQLGNRSDATRQNAQILSTVGVDAPSWKQYKGINSFSLEGKDTTVFSGTGNKIDGKTVFTSNGANVEDGINSKNSNYSSQPTSYKANDTWTLSADTTVNGIAYKSGEILTATQDSTTYNQAHWVKKVRYTDDTAVNNLQIGGRNLIVLNPQKWERGTIVSSGTGSGDGGSTTRIRQIEYYPCLPDTDYVISRHTSVGKALVVFYDNNKDRIINRGFYTSDGVIPSPSNASYFRVVFAYEDDSTILLSALSEFKFKLEKGNKATDWSPSPEDVQAAIDAAVVKATYWSVKSSAPVIYKDAINASTSGTHTPVTISGELRSGTTTTSGGFITVTPNGGAEAGAASASPVTIAPANGDGKTSYTVKLYDAAAKTTLLDTMTIPVVFKGASGVNAINAILSNEADVLPASPEGTVSDYSGSGTIIRVFEGAAELSYGTGNGQYQVSASGSGITAGAPSTSGNTRVYGVASNMTLDNATITFTITGKTASGASFSLTKVQSFAKSRIGQKGTDGISISLVDVEFAKNTIPATAPTTGWTTTAPSLSGDEQLWTRTKTTYSSGNPTYSTPANITPKKGDTGAVGQGVESVTEEYAISTSKTTQPTDGWSTTQPAWIQGQYIWSRVKVVYKNPASTIYTGYAVSSEWEAVNNLEIGGRNLILNSLNRIIFLSNAAATFPIQYELVSGENYIRFRRIYPEGITSTEISTYTAEFFTPEKSGYYTYSTYFRPNEFDIELRLSFNGLGDYTLCKANEWTQVSVTAYIEAGVSTRLYGVYGVMPPEAVQWIDYNRVSVTSGNKATDWSPAPEDVQAEIATAKQEALTAAGNAQTTANSLKDFTDTAFRNGIIDRSESIAIEKYKNSLNEAMSKAEASYNKVYTNTYLEGTAKTSLLNAKVNLWGQRDTLLSAIDTAISGGTTTPAQKTAVDNAFNTFNNLMTAFQNALEEANKSIQAKLDALSTEKVDNLEIGGKNLLVGSKDYSLSNPIFDGSTCTGGAVESDGFWVLTMGTPYLQINIPSKIAVGEKFTFSLIHTRRTTSAQNFQITYGSNIKQFNSNSDVQKLVFTAEKTSDSYLRISRVEGGSGWTLRVDELQLEKGDKATDFGLADEDVEAEIDEAKLTAEQAQLAADGYMRARYVRDYIRGNTDHNTNNWSEVKVVNKAGTNLALGKTPSANGTFHASYPASNVTDGLESTQGYISNSTPTLNYVEIDLGQIHYDIDYIGVWHSRSAQGRTYYGTKTEISVDGVNWTPVFDSAKSGTYKETELGNIISFRPNEVLAKVLRGAAVTDTFKTTINGGLISTVITEYRELNSEQVTGLISGIQGANKNLPFLVAGGTYAEGIAGTAKAIIRHDGTSKFTDAEVEGEVTAKEGKIGDMSIINGALTSNYSYFTYIGAVYVQVTVIMNLSQSGLILTSSYGGTTDHPQVVTWTCEIGHTSIKVGSMEMRRDGIYRDGTKIL